MVTERPLRRLDVAWPAAVVALGSLALYARTLMPGLGLWDTAEFQALGPVLGIAHPTGYPSYTLLLWLGSVVLQPFGDPALRANLLSALCISGAAALLAVAATVLTRRPLLGLLAGSVLALAPTVWRNALRADPHPLHLLLAALLLVLLLGWEARERAGEPRAWRWLAAVAILFGVALGNHALTLLLAPGIALFVVLVVPEVLGRRWRLVAGCVALTAATTILVYAYIPLRAAMHPPLDYAHPTSWEAFRYLVLGEQFQGAFRPSPSLDALATAGRRLGDELGLLAGLALLGALVAARRHGRAFALTGAWLVLTWAFALDYDNADIERYELVPLLVAVLWAALAVDWLWDQLPALWPALDPPAGDVDPRPMRAHRLAVALVALAVVAPLAVSVPGRFAQVDASTDTGARDWLEATLGQLAPDAAVVSWWSFSTPLWYAQTVEGRRPDIDVIDDRTILDRGLGDVEQVVDGLLGRRPVYLVRLDEDIPGLQERFTLEELPDIPSYGRVYRVTGRVGDDA